MDKLTKKQRFERGIPYYKLIGESLPITPNFLGFAKRRIGNLACFEYSFYPLLTLLAYAYILGLKDAIDYGESLNETK